MKYLRVLGSNVGSAIFDVLFVAVVSLTPLFLARLTPIIRREEPNLESGWLWSLLSNGQLAFYALGSLAAIALVVYKGESLPSILRLVFGAISLIFILFIAYLIGVDPSLKNAPFTFVGVTCFWLYLATLVMETAVASFKKLSLGAVLKAGDDQATQTADELAARKAG